jgi:hypothetical protein
MANPFVYEEPVGQEDLIDREEPAAALLDRLLDGRNSRLEAPRRYGKTSLIKKVLVDADRQGLVCVYVNFMGVLTAADVATRIETSYREQLDSPLRRWFDGLVRTLHPTVKAGAGPVAAAVTPSPYEVGLLERLAVPRKLYAKHGRSCAIVFDEFQDVLAAGDQIDATIRSELEQQGPAAAYVFSGSQPGMMRELFTSRRRGFYAQAGLIEIGPLAPDDLAEYIGDRFEHRNRDVGDALGPLLDLAMGHPQRAMLLAYHVYDRTRVHKSADTDTWARALDAACKEIDGEIQAVWRALPSSHQRLVTVIADGTIGLGTRAAKERYGLSRTGGHRVALEALEGDGQIVRADTRSGWSLVDPMFALWLRGGRAWPQS